MIDIIGTITLIVIAGITLVNCGLYLRVNKESLSRAKGVRNFYVKVFFEPYNPPETKASVLRFFIKNEGITPQNFCCIKDEKDNMIVIDKIYSKDGKTIEPQEMGDFYSYIIPPTINILKNSKSLFLVNIMNEKIKIAKKKDIQKILKEYRECQDRII